MDRFISFFVEFYKDPLFSIIILLSIIILVAIADYTRNRFKQKKREHSLKAMADNFNFYELDNNLNEALNFSKTPKETLIVIAQIYIQSGNFDDAIKIYLAILDKTSDTKAKIELFELLGSAYYKAGFMQRAKGIFIEILKTNPRNANALLLLMQTYETLGEYANALDVISCLEEVESVEKFKIVKSYIKMLILINDSLMNSQIREKEILKTRTTWTTKLALQYFLTHNQARFWELITQCESVENYIDLLWNLQIVRPNLVESHKQIADVYRAKGIICDEEECERFELEALRLLRKYSHRSCDLGFKYKCVSCQSVFPFEAYRCPNCQEVGEMSVLLEIVESK